jgi:hypothetical protein
VKVKIEQGLTGGSTSDIQKACWLIGVNGVRSCSPNSANEGMGLPQWFDEETGVFDAKVLAPSDHRLVPPA